MKRQSCKAGRNVAAPLVHIGELDYYQGMILSRLFRLLKLSIWFLIPIILVAPEWPTFDNELYQLNSIVGLRRFDFLVWELDALGTKVEAGLANGHSFLDTQARKNIVLDYLKLIQETKQLENRIELLFIDPNVTDPNSASKQMQQELAAKRTQLIALQGLAEAIVQDQVADILTEEGFGLLGQAWPPVLMHMTPLPSILLVSPRDRIERAYGIPLQPGLPTPTKEVMESAIFDQLNLSALVLPIGGLGTYPAMIIETSSINRLAEVTAHEWVHHWLLPYPISLAYTTNAQARTMNETVASIVGREISDIVIERFYPEFVPAPSPEPATSGQEENADEPPAFNFNREMAATRVEVDRLLAEGLIEEAESYMEQRRQLMVENGWNIRKLNQAYFAFHGAYADEPGATGGDPIGPLLLELRTESASLRIFLKRVTQVVTLDDLKKAVAEAREGK